MKLFLRILVVLISSSFLHVHAAPNPLDYSQFATDAAQIVKNMSLEEKIGQMTPISFMKALKK